MSEVDELVDKLLQELRRGTITIGVLSQLAEPQYGYSLVTILSEKGVQVEPGTLYPLLRRLEKQGLLESQWDTNKARPRKYYLLSATGKQVFDQLKVEWKKIVASMDVVLNDKGESTDGDD
ncbi:PadR family transcriptional regulator [Sediminibacillus albus]|uniref:DNA-binding transcriptional regulator, PadR family n=1 Tax=Sediminibacillus albus TaxID=407036 RepID=A0A1G8WNZ9_9BACI|nr:helix-turn-helix transcriptional regulator [Sediminibacillus albus]SDJ80098.1 DNA-binding transcriptional regulator, PadR family [Sediminibacillus albus]